MVGNRALATLDLSIASRLGQVRIADVTRLALNADATWGGVAEFNATDFCPAYAARLKGRDYVSLDSCASHRCQGNVKLGMGNPEILECQAIDGSFTIDRATPVFDLPFTRITGDQIIYGQHEDTFTFPNLAAIGGRLKVPKTNGISPDSFPKLTEAGGLEIHEERGLHRLPLQHVRLASTLHVTQTNLRSIHGLVMAPVGTVHVHQNAKLRSVSVEFGGPSLISISINPTLQTLSDPCTKATSLGTFLFNNNAQAQAIVLSCQKINGLFVADNSQLRNASFPLLEQSHYYTTIRGTDQLLIALPSLGGSRGLEAKGRGDPTQSAKVLFQAPADA